MRSKNYHPLLCVNGEKLGQLGGLNEKYIRSQAGWNKKQGD